MHDFFVILVKFKMTKIVSYLEFDLEGQGYNLQLVVDYVCLHKINLLEPIYIKIS